jgi:hypothetical protein
VWGALDDVVMGGVSESTFQILPAGSETGGPAGLFKGIYLIYLTLYMRLCICLKCCYCKLTFLSITFI